MHVTRHAIMRYRERVADLPDAAVRDALSSPAIQCAADFGARTVKLGTGQRVVLDGATVVTVVQKAPWYFGEGWTCSQASDGW
jgi:hypothetical protein